MSDPTVQYIMDNCKIVLMNIGAPVFYIDEVLNVVHLIFFAPIFLVISCYIFIILYILLMATVPL